MAQPPNNAGAVALLGELGLAGPARPANSAGAAPPATGVAVGVPGVAPPGAGPVQTDTAAPAAVSDPAAAAAAAKAAARAERIRDKNRRAQRNFRERQRVRDQTADARLADLASRIVSLEAEGAALRARARVLEAFVTLRAASPSSSSGDDGGGGAKGSGCPAAGDGAAAATTPGGTERHVPPTTTTGATPSNSSQGTAALVAPDDPPLDWASVAPLWGSITTRLRGALPLAGAAADPSAATAGEEVATLVQEASALLASVALAEGDAYGGFGAAPPPSTPADPTGPAPPAPLALAASIGLSAAQKTALIDARRSYLTSMASLQRGRTSIASALQGLPEPVPWTGAPASRAFLHIAGAVEALGRHVRAGRIAATTFTGTAWRDVLTPAQAGALILATSPARPCLLDLARALAVEAGLDDEVVGGEDGGAGAGAGGAAAMAKEEEEEVDGAA